MPTYPSSINRQTTITFPLNNNRTAITTGIETGSLYINKLLFTKQLNFGEANSDRFEVTLFDCDDISGETIQVYQTDYANPNSPVVTNLFYGVVDSCKKEDNEVNRRLVAYDLMYTIGNQDATEWWNTYWEGKISDTVSNILTDLLFSFSVTLSSDSTTLLANIDTADLTIMQFSGFSAITFGTILSYLCQALMCNPHFNADGELDLIVLGARFTGNIVSVTDSFEDENSHFEDYVTEPITRVVIYGETDTIAGEYGSGDNVYVIKGNPLLYNLVDTDYNTLAQTIYENIYNAQASTGYVGVCYTPANIKMIVSSVGINLGDIASATIGSSVVNSVISSIELSGPMLIEQTITSSGNQKLTPDDFNDTSSTAGRALEQATTTSRHFVWVPNEGAFVTTDDTPAGQAPTDNYTKLTEDGLYVTTNGEQVAHFGVDENDKPVSVLGSMETTGTSVKMSDEGIVAGKQITDTVKSDYFSISVPSDAILFQTIYDYGGVTVDNNRGYIQTLPGYSYIDVSKIEWYASFSVGDYQTTGYWGYFATELSHTRSGFDIFIDMTFDAMFSHITDTSLTSSSTLREWLVEYGVPSTRKYVLNIIPYEGTLDRTVNIFFYNNNRELTEFSNATYLSIYYPSDFNIISPYKMLRTDEYSFNPNDIHNIELLDYTYYDKGVRTITSSIGNVQYYLPVSAVNTGLWYDTNITFKITTLLGEVQYKATIGNSVATNLATNSIVLGDGNTTTATSEQDLYILGKNNTIDNLTDRPSSCHGTVAIGGSNIINHQESYAIGRDNQLLGDKTTDGLYNNFAFGWGNFIRPAVTPDRDKPTSDGNVAIGFRNRIAGINNMCLGYYLYGNHIAYDEYSDGAELVTIGRSNVDPILSNYPALVVGNGVNNHHNAMEVGDGLILFPLVSNAITLKNGGQWGDENIQLNLRYEDTDGTQANFIELVPTGTSTGVILGIGAGALTVVGGGESADAIATNPGSIGLTTASEALICSADTAINFISNAQTIANYKKALFGTDGYFQINECSGTGINLAYFDSSGKLKRDSRSFYSKGDSFSGWSFAGLGGHLTSSQKEVVVFIPMPFPPSLISTSGLTIKMTIRHANGGYPYIYNSSTQINGTNVVNNGTKMSGLSSVSFDSRSISGMSLHLTFANALQRSASSTSTAITNNTPLAVALEISGSFVST